MVEDREVAGGREGGEKWPVCQIIMAVYTFVILLLVGASENVSYFTSSPPFQQESAYLVLDQWCHLLPVTLFLHSKSSFHHFNSMEVEIFSISSFWHLWRC